MCFGSDYHEEIQKREGPLSDFAEKGETNIFLIRDKNSRISFFKSNCG
jgi:hypothetical protein